MLREDAASPRRERREPGADLAVPGEATSTFEALRAWRATQAKAQAIPPYVIFHDSVLREIATVRPADLGALGQIKGVGVSKLERYGAQVLDVLLRAA